MTLLDVIVMILLTLIATGGYWQGFVRGLVRIATLVVIGLLAAALMLSVPFEEDLQTIMLRSVALLIGVTILTGALAWLINRAVPPAIHASRWNRALGVVPALLQGLIVAVLALGVAHRVALEPQLQDYIARGMITGPLLSLFDWLELTLAGVR